jgi:hypothetical protein
MENENMFVEWRADSERQAQHDAHYAANEWAYYGMPIRIVYPDENGTESYMIVGG